MANSGLYDPSQAEDLRLDEIVAGSRAAYMGKQPAVNGGTLALNVLGTNWLQGYGAPTNISSATNITLNAFQINPQIVTVRNTAAGANINVTFDTAANLVGLLNARGGGGAVVGDVIQVLIINDSTTASNTLTLVAGSGGTINPVNATTIAIASSKQVFIRVTNVTGGSEAYTVYF